MTVSNTCAKCRVKREMVHQMRAWSQIAPLLKKFLQKSEFSDFIAIFSPSVGFDTYFDSQQDR